MAYFTIAGLQLELKSSDNLDYVTKKIRSTLSRFPFVQMVVVSELAICGAGVASAETLPSQTETKLCALAKSLGIWLVPGSIYEKIDGKVYNVTPVINPKGEVVTRYQKMYPFYPYEQGVEAGNEICVFDVPEVGCFGVSICYDMWFPETIRAMALAGAEVIIHPTLTDTRDRDIECAMVRSNAAQNQCYMFDVNGAGDLANGNSLIAGPEGEVVHAAGTSQEIMVVEVDLNHVRRTRDRGLMGLGQTLKSYRDAAHKFEHEGAIDKSELLSKLGPLTVPERGK